MVKVQMRTGRTPRRNFDKYPELQRAFRLKNRMENGFDIGLSDMSYREMVMVEHLNSWISEAKNREYKKQNQFN